ncbi:hypothetical protein ANN_14652 [Periplaneta americana]|uniref:Uncharacterized protein n=1 Tax=Periplaneta americana TaxID=6978 RepID=A0ABQ8SZ06_PERAM|nr:hypothetical protein ANN_14652 [Periplaneta americana]
MNIETKESIVTLERFDYIVAHLRPGSVIAIKIGLSPPVNNDAKYRLRVFENKVLKKIFGAKRDEVTGEWRKLHNTELHALYSSPDIIKNIKSRRLRWAGHVARMGESRNAYRVLVGRPGGKRPLGRQRRRWEDNIKMDMREVGYDDREWINLAQENKSIFYGPLEKGLRKRLVKCFIWSVALYGAETWTLRRNEANQLEAFEMGYGEE